MNFLKNMNLPNRLTVIRMVLIIPFVICMLAGKGTGASGIAALVIFIAAAATDAIDGKIARSRGLVTDFGKFMDPLADKLLVVSALICLLDLKRIPVWAVLIIIAREFIISGFRLIASDNGIVIAAGIWGKIKTVVQMVMTICLIIYKGPFVTIGNILVYAAVALTVISLVDYIYHNAGVLASDK